MKGDRIQILRTLIKSFVPPIVVNFTRPIRRKFNSDKVMFSATLFEGDDFEYKRKISSAKVIGEYGIGSSTVWAINNSQAEIVAVESSTEWSSKVQIFVDFSARLHLNIIDLGPIGPWGRPDSYSKRSEFDRYIFGIWGHPLIPDVVLVDGRFRVACFLASILSVTKKTTIFFDDYVDRDYYHVVEEIIKPVRFCGRQAIFEVDQMVSRQKAEELLNSFIHVMD